MNALLKLNSKQSSLLDGFRLVQSAFALGGALDSLPKISSALPNISAARTHYSFNLKNNIRYRRATRPKKSSNESIPLTYEQTQFAENIGVTKSWNSWNTCK